MVALSDYAELFQTAFADRAVRRAERPGTKAPYLWPAGIAADAGRPRDRRRADRGRVAAGAADRSLAEPADAARTWPRSAGAAHRPFRARFCPAARHRGRDPHPFREGRRRAGGGVALPAPAGGRRRARRAGKRRRPPANAMCISPRELDRPAEVEPIAQPAPKPPRATRPLKLSVTAIEDWLRDPYTIYASTS